MPLLTLASSSVSGVTFISLMKFHNVSIPNLQYYYKQHTNNRMPVIIKVNNT